MTADVLDENVLGSVKASLIEKAVAELLDSAWEMHGERDRVFRRAVIQCLIAAVISAAAWLLLGDGLWILPAGFGMLFALQGMQWHAQLGGELVAIATLAATLRNDGLVLNSTGTERSIQFTYAAHAEFRRVQRTVRMIAEAPHL